MNMIKELQTQLENLIKVTRQYVAPGIPEVDEALLSAEITLGVSQRKPLFTYPHADAVEAAEQEHTCILREITHS